MDSGKNDEFTVSDEVVENLQKDFDDAMAALAEHESFDRFRMEYDVLYRALRKSHDSEKQLVKRCQQLTQELMSNAAKVQAALKLSQADHTTIDALKKEIEKAWRMVDSANEKDAHAKETMKNLKEEVATLQEIMANGAELTSSQSATLEGLKLEKKRMEMEYSELVKQMDNLTKEIRELNAKSKELEGDIMNNQEEFKRVTDKENLVQQEYDKEQRACERADFQVREQLHLAQQRGKELKTHEQLRSTLAEAVKKLRAQVQEDNERRHVLEQKIETAEKQLYHTQQSYYDALDTTEALNERHRAVCKEIADAEKAASDLLSEEQRTRAIRDADYKKLRRLVQQNDDVRQEYENLVRQQVSIQKRIDAVKKERNAMNSAYEVLVKEQETLKKYGEHERKKLRIVEDIIENELESQKDVEAAIEREREISARLQKTIAKLESEREKYAAEVLQATEQHVLVTEDLKVATITCDETQKAIDESEQRLKKQQGLYEQARAERNLYTKKLIESQDEVMELKQGFRMMDHQIRQLKEELAMKEKKFQDETSAQKMAKEKLAKVRRIVNERTTTLDDTNRNCENISQNIKQLVKVVNECDKQLTEQRQMFLSVSNERDVLGTQLIRRNDELALLYEKIRMQQEVLSRGYAASRARQEDMRLLRLKTDDLKRQAKIADQRAQDTKRLQEDIKQLVYDLTVQRAKVQALTEEAENPKSSLRWEKVDGRNPTAEELNQKIFRLQRRLITKSEECVEKDMELQEKQRLLTELTNILARQPGPEVVQRLNMCQRELHRTCSVMKQKASELNMTGTHFAELKYEAERLRREVNDTRRKYYEMRMSNDELTRMMDASKNGKS